jgi:regulatory protein
MKRVTAIRGGKRVKIFLDGKFAFSLEAEVAIKQGLGVEQELSEGDIKTLTKADLFHRCLNAALHYLSYRPRSEAELRQRLYRRGFDGDNVEAAINKLREQGLANDMAFAEFWKDNRQSFRPRSRWLTKLELRQKGVSENIIDQVVADVDDKDNAYRAAIAKAHSLPTTDYHDFRLRLGEYLKRRGFSYGVISHTVERVWQERGGVGVDSTPP